jgi:predicted SnoaL-like aldol condensation-catalyzing enzyme
MQDPSESNKLLIQQMFREVLEPDSFDRQVIDRYFSPGYVQHVDGKTLDFAGFLNHLRELKQSVTNLRIHFEHIVAEGDQVMEIHRVTGENRAGGTFVVRLFSLWVIEEGKIVLCDEVSRLEQGAAEDRDWGSRTSKS